MKTLLQLMGQAWAENTRDRIWDFELKGLTEAIIIRFYPHGVKLNSKPLGGIFYNDKPGLAAACKFIQDNLKVK